MAPFLVRFRRTAFDYDLASLAPSLAVANAPLWVERNPRPRLRGVRMAALGDTHSVEDDVEFGLAIFVDALHFTGVVRDFMARLSHNGLGRFIATLEA
jgi:hypothetical protein